MNIYTYIDLAKAMKDILKSNDFDMSLYDMNKISCFQKKYDKVVSSLLKRKQVQEKRQFAYIRLEPKKIEKKVLFGSSVPTDTVFQLSLCSAIRDSEQKWVPNENDIYFKGILTESMLGDLVFNRNTCNNTPFTFTELNGKQLDIKSRKVKNKYGISFNDQTNKIKKISDQLIEKINELNNPNVRIDTKSRDFILEKIALIKSYAKEDLDFELEQDSLNFQKDMNEIKEIITTSLTHSILETDALCLENKKCDFNKTSEIEDFFNAKYLNSDKVVYQEINNLLKAFCNTLDNNESRIIKNNVINSIPNACKIDSYENAEITNASIVFSQVETTQALLFGNANRLNKYCQLTFSFAKEEIDRFGKQKINSFGKFLSLDLSNTQMMGLLRGGFDAGWEKVTLSHYLDMRMPQIQSQEDADDNLRVLSPRMPDTSKSIVELTAAMYELAQNKSQSKKIKAQLLEQAKHIKNVLYQDIENREQIYKASQAEMAQNYQDKMVSELKKMSIEIDGKYKNTTFNFLNFLENK